MEQHQKQVFAFGLPFCDIVRSSCNHLITSSNYTQKKLCIDNQQIKPDDCERELMRIVCCREK